MIILFKSFLHVVQRFGYCQKRRFKGTKFKFSTKIHKMHKYST